MVIRGGHIGNYGNLSSLFRRTTTLSRIRTPAVTPAQPPPTMSDAAAARDADAEMLDAAAAAGAPPGDDEGEGDTEDDNVDDEEDPRAPASAQEAPEPQPVSALPADPNQLTLLFQGEVYVFDSVTPDKVSP
jgi:hypothetical protein